MGWSIERVLCDICMLIMQAFIAGVVLTCVLVKLVYGNEGVASLVRCVST